MSALGLHRDSVVDIACEGDAMLGLLSEPIEAAALDVGVLLIVGGPQYRVGSHRQFTLLARRLASSGVPCLRIDYRGMGDAEGAQRSFDDVDADIAAAIDSWQQQRPGLRRVVLWGLCDAASAALLYVHRRADARIAGLCLANPWVRTQDSLARTQVRHYYLQRLRQGAFWRKLLSGRVGLSAVRELIGKLGAGRAGAAPSPASGAGASAGSSASGAKASTGLQVAGTGAPTGAPSSGTTAPSRHYTEQMAQGLRAFTGPVLLVLSGDDYVAKEFLDRCRDGGSLWRGLLQRRGLERADLPQADHTFSSAAWRGEVEALTLAFIRERVAHAAPAPARAA